MQQVCEFINEKVILSEEDVGQRVAFANLTRQIDPANITGDSAEHLAQTHPMNLRLIMLMMLADSKLTSIHPRCLGAISMIDNFVRTDPEYLAYKEDTYLVVSNVSALTKRDDWTLHGSPTRISLDGHADPNPMPHTTMMALRDEIRMLRLQQKDADERITNHNFHINIMIIGICGYCAGVLLWKW